MSKFYNPYQFIPVTGHVDEQRPREPFDDIAAGRSTSNPQVRHDLWHRDAQSGRIIVAMHLETPTVVGRAQVSVPGSEAKRVEQYQWRGQPAVPASSLKGMLSSLAEALSQSTLRVLNADMGTPENRGRMRINCDRNDSDPDCRAFGTRKVDIPLTAEDYFAHIDPDLIPWRHPRDKLTPAELLFGTVEVDAKGSNKNSGRNLAGRVRLYDARGAGTLRTLPEVMLRILGGPKPPSPPFYFHQEGHRGAFLSKRQLVDHVEDHRLRPNGRKFYLPHPETQYPPQWETGNPRARANNKLICGPIADGQDLYFHIDFDNLSAAELTLLETTLAPSDGFLHRLGLGKALGLGAVRLRTEAVLLVDRGKRYGSDALSAPQRRYHQVWRSSASSSAPAWQTMYPVEAAALQQAGSKPGHLQDLSLIDSATLKTVQTLGNPANLITSLAVRTPITDGQDNAGQSEDKTFLWFVDNDKIGNQALGPIDPDAEYPAQRIPPLFSDAREAQKNGRITVANFDQEDDTSGAGSISDDPIAQELNTWIEELIDTKQAADIEVALRGKVLAKRIVGGDDGERRQALFDALLDRLAQTADDDLERELLPNQFSNAVRKIYAKAGLC